MNHYDVIIIGAGAAGLMCAIEAGKRHRRVLIVDHANKAGKKILMSGGGRCNFTNTAISADNYLSNNPHFCKSALSRFTQWDFIDWVERHQIPYHERAHGQLFCNDSAADILTMLLDECRDYRVQLQLNTTIRSVQKHTCFSLESNHGHFSCDALVVASGGLSIPRMCASPYGLQLAKQFKLNIIPTRAGLVPFTLQPQDKERLASLSGIAVECIVSNDRASFRENLLFTHRGLSGPAMLQLSSYWQSGEEIEIDLLPEQSIVDLLKMSDVKNRQLKTVLSHLLPKRLVTTLVSDSLAETTIHHLSNDQLIHLTNLVHHWRIQPNGTEGYRTAEVTIGGVDCNELSSKTMECRSVDGLYFIGEVIDVSGWLGGYNFQWAWSSGWVAGQYV